MNYTIREFRTIMRSELEPHPDAEAFPSDVDDREIVEASVTDCGVLQPLIVMAKPSGGYWVLDGIGRMNAGNYDLPCLVVECDEPRMLAMNINSAGRKRSTGSRVLCYLMANRERVLAAAEAAGGGGNSHMTVRGGGRKNRADISADLEPWTIRKISQRLGVSDKDVSYALELMTCFEKGVYPSISIHGRIAPGTPIQDGDDYDAMKKSFYGVMSGRLPVRRWPAAFAGKVNLKGDGRAPTDFVALGHRTAISLKNVFENWQRIPMSERESILGELADALAVAPDDVRALMREASGSGK